MPIIKRRPRVTLLGVLAALAALSVLGALLAVRAVLAGTTNELFSTRADVTIPDLIGLDSGSAYEAIRDTGLAVEWRQDHSAIHGAGEICAQEPRAGRTVKQGQKLVLTVSLGEQVLTVPDVERRPQREAADALRDAGFNVRVEFIEDGTLDAYTVVGMDPAAGAACPAGTVVTLTVTRPKPDAFRQVPQLTGLSVAEARARLQIVGLTARIIGDAQTGTVTYQSPKNGEILHAYSAVTLYVR